QDNSTRYTVTGGIIVSIVYPGTGMTMEFATDNAVIWTRGASVDLAQGFSTNKGSSKTEVELYLAGNVVIRTRSNTTVPFMGRRDYLAQTLFADEVYYDVERHRAIALSADLELSSPALSDSVHMRGKEVWRLGADDWQIKNADFYSSKLPSDPGIKLNT